MSATSIEAQLQMFLICNAYCFYTDKQLAHDLSQTKVQTNFGQLLNQHHKPHDLFILAKMVSWNFILNPSHETKWIVLIRLDSDGENRFFSQIRSQSTILLVA